ncbi:nucleoside diphosphate kinase 3 isoform X3 [Monodelphis domestica]|uniref:nucleoside diphosphate kinase 3 isoform X3 n=1 Tax=Monodelphis domestica TaxID=13616 RepID=UPI0004435E83|nr:nucleoside diphosphate kinase 3 isoform X3 [Monodelphis domestica]
MICLVLTIFANIFPSAWTGLNERTFLAIKPDGFQRRLVGEIIRRFEKKGFKLVGLKLVQASEDLLREHYSALRDRPFYSRLVKYMSSGPVVAMVWQGLDVVRSSRALIGATNPADSAPGTIRGDFCIEVETSFMAATLWTVPAGRLPSGSMRMSCSAGKTAPNGGSMSS